VILLPFFATFRDIFHYFFCSLISLFSLTLKRKAKKTAPEATFQDGADLHFDTYFNPEFPVGHRLL